MNRITRWRPSPAMVVAMLALLVALTGTATGAAPFIKSGDPAGGDLTGTYPDPTIAGDAVDSGKVADDSLTGADIDESTLAGGARVITRIEQTVAPLQSGDGMANKTDLQVSGGEFVKRANEFLQFFPGVGIDPPETCTTTNPFGPALFFDYVDAVSNVSFSSMIPYDDLTHTGPQLAPIEEIEIDPPGALAGEANVDLDVFAWDTCEGENERWGFGGLGFPFHMTILGTV